MKAEDYTHRIGRTGRAGRDGLAITFAELRDRRKIFDIEAYTRQPIKADVIAGLEPKQRIPEAPRPGFASRNGGGRDARGPGRGFAGPREGFSYERKGGFNDRFAGQGAPRGEFAPRRDFAPRADAGAPRGDFAPRRDFAPRADAGAPRKDFAPRGDFAARKPAFGKPAGFAKPANGGKVFVPRDAKKRAARSAD
jgi:superfamily II DNA/RNA helicase